MSLTPGESNIWDLLEGDCLPSEIEPTRRAYLDVLADVWDAAIDAASEQGTIQIPDNPYRVSEEA